MELRLKLSRVVVVVIGGAAVVAVLFMEALIPFISCFVSMRAGDL